MSLELLVRGPDSLREVAVVVALEEVDDHLGIRLRPEGVPLRQQIVSQLAVVLDDSV